MYGYVGRGKPCFSMWNGSQLPLLLLLFGPPSPKGKPGDKHTAGTREGASSLYWPSPSLGTPAVCMLQVLWATEAFGEISPTFSCSVSSDSSFSSRAACGSAWSHHGKSAPTVPDAQPWYENGGGKSPPACIPPAAVPQTTPDGGGGADTVSGLARTGVGMEARFSAKTDRLNVNTIFPRAGC